MGVRVSSIQRDPLNPDNLHTPNSADKPKVRFDLTLQSEARSCSTSYHQRIPMVNSQFRGTWPRSSSTWRRTCGSVLALFGVVTLVCAMVLHNGTFSFSIGKMNTILVSSRQLFRTHTRLFSSKPRHNPQLPALTDNLLARSLPLGRYDYALSSHGGKLFLPLTSREDPNASSTPIDTILSDDFRINAPWRFRHSHAQVGLSFPLTIYPTHFSIDYAFNPDPMAAKSAPRELVIWGVVEGSGNKARYARSLGHSELFRLCNRTTPPLHHGETFMPLGSAEYDVYGGPHVQTFALHPGVVKLGINFGVVVLEVVSNWGGDETWLYRVRVHGSVSVKP